MKKGFTTFLSALKANTPPCKKGLSSLRFLSLFLILFLAVGNVWGADDVYYVMLYNNITDAGVLTSSSTLNNGIVKYSASTGKYASSTDITVTGMGSSKASKYSNSSISNFTTVGNWAAGSGTAYAAGGKFTALTIKLGTKTASSIKFIGYRNSSSTGEMTISETAKTTAKKPSNYGNDCLLEWTGNFTGDVSVSVKDNKEHVGVFVITVPEAKYSVTYKAGDGTGDDVVDSDAKTVKAFADCSFTAPSGYEFKEWQDGSSNVVAAGATVSANMTLTAIYRLIPTKYTVTYNLNGASGDAPTETSKAEGDAFNLAAAPSWAGHAFDGWLCSADEAVKAAGSSYTMTAANTTFTAQWHEVDCKIYSLTGGIGSAVIQQANATVNDGVSLILSNSDGIIKLSPASGSFNAGDIVTISGTVGNTTKEFGVKISNAADKKATLGTASVAGTTNPMVATATLSAASDYLYICRTGGTTQTILTCEVHRACAEGTAAGLSYAEASVNKYTTDAAFTNPLTNTNGLVLAGYKSSNEEVATVNFSTGEVTIVGVGNATISVGSAVQTKAGTLYAAGTASYTLTVAAPPTFAVTYDNKGGDGTMTDSNSPYTEGAEVTLLDNTFTAPSGYAWSAWAVTETVSGNPVAVSEGKFTMPGVAVTVTAQWALIADFDVKFFQGYGDPNAQIGETQTISTGDYATAPTDPERAGFAFLGWSYDGTEAHIVDVATYGITAATNFTAMWKAVWTVTFDGAGNVEVQDGETVASPNSPVLAGKVFQGWYNGESKYDFSAAVTGNLALTSKWADANANHFYYTYNDDFHYDGDVYKTPEGKTTDPAASEATLNLTTPYTVYSGAEGITSIVATNGVYDYKKGADTKHVTAYLKLKKNDATSNLAFTIKSGYTAVLKIKMGGYSNNPVVTLKKGDDAVPATSGTIGGTATGKNYYEITYNLTAGTYVMTSADQTLYISHIDLEATALPTFTVTYKPGEGSGAEFIIDDDATEVSDGSTMFTAPEGQVFNGWKDESDNDVEVGAIVSADMALTAQWINVYAVTFNLNGQSGSIAPQSIKHGEKATKPADPVVIDQEFGGWFTDAACTEGNEFDFNTPITAAKELFAKWTADPCPDKKSVVKVVMTAYNDAAVTGYNNNEYAGGKIINYLSNSSDNKNTYDFGEGEVTGYKLAGSKSAIMATLAKGDFEYGDKIVVAVTNPASAQKLRIYAASDVDHVLLVKEIDAAAAGIYEYKFTSVEIEAINDAGYKSIGVFRGDYNPFIYSVELKGCRSWAVFHTLTFKNFDGTADIAAVSLEEGAYASTVAPAAPKITLKRFLGWSEDMNGTPVELTSYAITDDKTLYAVYEDIVCPAKGTVYSLAFDATATAGEGVKYTVNKNNDDVKIPASIAAISGGEAYFGTTANDDVTILVKDGETAFRANNSNNYMHLVVECPLQVGDTIAFTSSTTRELNFYKNAPSGTSVTSSSQKIIITNTEHALYGAEVIYIKGGNAACTVKTINIIRPAVYDITFNMMGHGDQVAAIEDVLDGHKIAAPSPAPTDAAYRFGGWYKDNTLENEWDFDNDVVTDNITLYAKWVDKSDATLKSLKYGTTEIALEAGVYTYAVNLSPLATDVPALTAVPSNPSATAVVTNAAALDSEGHATSTVLVTPEEGGSPQTYTVNFTKLHIYTELADVTETTSWNWNGVATDEVKINDVAVRGLILANYIDAPNFEKLEGQENARAYRSTTYPAYQGTYLRFHATKPGRLTMNVRNSSGSPKLYVNGGDPIATLSGTRKDYNVIVPAGDVIITSTDGEMRIYNMTYKLLEELTPDYTRDVRQGYYGTICLPNGGIMTGAAVYEIAYMDYKDDAPYKIYFDEILNGKMEAGVPYIFLPNEGADKLAVFYTDEANESAKNANGLYGFIGTSATDEYQIPGGVGNYIIQNNQYREVLAGADARIVNNRAYIKLSEVPGYNDPLYVAPEPAPGRKRVAMGTTGAQVATGVDQVQGDEVPTKMIINGQLFILRGEKMYDAQGKLVR